jgi:hypothetical protein
MAEAERMAHIDDLVQGRVPRERCGRGVEPPGQVDAGLASSNRRVACEDTRRSTGRVEPGRGSGARHTMSLISTRRRRSFGCSLVQRLLQDRLHVGSGHESHYMHFSE